MTAGAVTVKKDKKKKTKKKQDDDDEADDPFAVAVPDGMAPVAPEPLKKKNKKAAKEEPEEAAVPAPAAAAPAPLTMAQKVAKIGGELGLEEGLPLAKAVAAANEAMGVEAEGTMAQQVQAPGAARLG